MDEKPNESVQCNTCSECGWELAIYRIPDNILTCTSCGHEEPNHSPLMRIKGSIAYQRRRYGFLDENNRL